MKINYANRKGVTGLTYQQLSTGHYIGAESGRLYWVFRRGGEAPTLYDLEKKERCTTRASRSGYWHPADVTLTVNSPPWPA